jgi:ABC-2 type transport system ATP-binding protein
VKISEVAGEVVAGRVDGDIALEVRGLGKRYRRREVLRDCTFSVPAGRVTAVAGSNGAGKTTLLSILAGLLVPSEGEIRFGGDERIAFVSQNKPLYRQFSVADMLRLGRELNPGWDQGRAAGLLERFDIAPDRRCGKLSGGQQAQVAFALALGARPSVLLLDEPLANVDPVARRTMTEELLTEVAETGTTVLMSTHVLTELGGVADYLLLLSDGRLLLDGDIDDILAEHARYTGPRSDTPPPHGEVVHARHTEDQSSFVMRRTGTAGLEGAVPDQRWITRPATLEDLVVAHLTATKERAA